MHVPFIYRNLQNNYSFSSVKPASRDNAVQVEARTSLRRSMFFLMKVARNYPMWELILWSRWTDISPIRKFMRSSRKDTTSLVCSRRNTRTLSRFTLNIGLKIRTGITTKSCKLKKKFQINWIPISCSFSNWATLKKLRRRLCEESTSIMSMKSQISCDHDAFLFLKYLWNNENLWQSWLVCWRNVFEYDCKNFITYSYI